jgi:hypothetical protein
MHFKFDSRTAKISCIIVVGRRVVMFWVGGPNGGARMWGSGLKLQ